MPGRNYEATTPYRYGFNGKEKDNSTAEGSYDFGARIYDGRLGRWLSIDPLFKQYPSINPFCFVINSPIQAYDPDGEKVLWVNGFWSLILPNAGKESGKKYWSDDFIERGNEYLKDKSNKFIDGGYFLSTSNGKERFDAGYEYAKSNYNDLVSGMKKDKDGNITETMKIVSHSMGAAYSEGIIKYLEENKITVERVVHFSPADNSGFTPSSQPRTTQLDVEGDPVLKYKNFDDSKYLKNVDSYGLVDSEQELSFRHGSTKSETSMWDEVENLDRVVFEKTGLNWKLGFLKIKWFDEYKAHNLSSAKLTEIKLEDKKTYKKIGEKKYESPQ